MSASFSEEASLGKRFITIHGCTELEKTVSEQWHAFFPLWCTFHWDMSSTVYKKFTSFESLTSPFPLLFLLLLFFWFSLVLFCFVCISSELEAPFLDCCVREKVINYSLSSYIRSLIAIFLEENLTKKQICHVSRGAHIHQRRKKLSQFIIKNHCWNKIALRTPPPPKKMNLLAHLEEVKSSVQSSFI